MESPYTMNKFIEERAETWNGVLKFGISSTALSKINPIKKAYQENLLEANSLIVKTLLDLLVKP